MELRNSQQPLKPTSKISTQTITKAVEALLKWKKSTLSKSQNPQLLPSDEFLYLVLTLNKIPSKKPRINAHKIPLPNPLYTPESSEFCLFVHDSMSKLAKQKVDEGEVPVSNLIKLSKLKKDYREFEQKRKLCDSYDMFFADKRIITLLPNVIGKHFYKKKKVPVPIELGRGNWKDQIERACSSSMLYLSSGTCSVIKVGKDSMSKGEIVENVVAAMEGIVGVIPKKWGNVRCFHLKFSESLALPVYQKVPELGFKIEGSGFEEESVAVETKGEGKKGREKVVKKKGRIHEVRHMDDDVVGGMVREDEFEGDDDEEVMEGKKSVGVGIVGKKGDGVMEVKNVEKLKKGVKSQRNKVLV